MLNIKYTNLNIADKQQICFFNTNLYYKALYANIFAHTNEINSMGQIRKTALLIIFGISTIVTGQNFTPDNWISLIDDNVKLSSLSIPGAHDAATGEGLNICIGLGVTQKHTLSELWDNGIRAFDLRPAVKKDGLHIYHGPIATKISFDDAIAVICKKLDSSPDEFAIILLREEKEAENSEEQKKWATYIGTAINNLGERAAIFSPEMTVKDLRGKILFLSRDNYNGTDKGAIITGWNHSSTGTANAVVTSLSGRKKAQLQVQDFYRTTNKEEHKIKTEVVKQFIDKAANGVLTINMISGYNPVWATVNPFATNSAYKRNAARVNNFVVQLLGEKASRIKKPLGIIFMDYAATDYASGSLWHWQRYKVNGKELVRLIIENNFAE